MKSILIEEFKKLIAEEQGIAAEAFYKASEICDDLEKEITKTKNIPFNRDYVWKKEGQKQYELWGGKQVTVIWTYYNFYNQHIYDKESDSIPKGSAINSDCSKIIVNIWAISGRIMPITFFDSIHHEVEHAYKFYKANKNFSFGSIYQFATYQKSNYGFNKETPMYILSDIIYQTREYEQDAYNNGLYALLMKKYASDVWSVVEESPMYIGLQQLIKEVEEIKKCDENSPEWKGAFNVFRKNYDYDKKRFIKEGELAIKNIKRLIARTVNKARTDLTKAYHFTDKYDGKPLF